MESRHLFLLMSVALSAGAQASVCSRPVEKGAVAASGEAIDHYFFDAALNKKWAVEVDCAHPERPAVIAEADSQEKHSGSEKTPSPVARQEAEFVRAGSTVDLWKKGSTQIQLSGVALDSAPVGQSIRVRAGLGNHVLHGVVRGSKSVELADRGDAQWGEP